MRWMHGVIVGTETFWECVESCQCSDQHHEDHCRTISMSQWRHDDRTCSSGTLAVGTTSRWLLAERRCCRSATRACIAQTDNLASGRHVYNRPLLSSRICTWLDLPHRAITTQHELLIGVSIRARISRLAATCLSQTCVLRPTAAWLQSVVNHGRHEGIDKRSFGCLAWVDWHSSNDYCQWCIPAAEQLPWYNVFPIAMQIQLSSANKWRVTSCHSTMFARSATYNTKSSGPNTEPYDRGTGVHDSVCPLMQTDNEQSHVRAVLHKPSRLMIDSVKSRHQINQTEGRHLTPQ